MAKVFLLSPNPHTAHTLLGSLPDSEHDLIWETPASASLQSLAESTPALLILDLQMPALTGAELVFQVRAHEHLHALPILLLVDGLDPKRGQSLAGCLTLSYPLKTELVRGALERALESRAFFGTPSPLSACCAIQWHNLFARHPLPMWICHREDLRFLAVNEAALRAYGYSRQEFLSMSAANIRPAEDLERFQQEQRLNTPEEALNRGTWRHRKKNGQILFAEVTTQPVEFEGVPARFVVAMDVTDRQRAEEAHRQSEQRFRKIADSMPQIVWTMTAEGVVDYLNTQFERTTGIPAESLEALHTYIHAEDLEPTLKAWESALKTGSELRIEHRVRMADGRFHWHLSREVPVHDESGRIVKRYGTATDIDVQKRTEEKLRASEEHLRMVFESATDGIWEWDIASGKLTWASQIFAMLGLDEATFEPTVEKFRALVHADDLEAFDAAAQAHWSFGKVFRLRLRLRHRDGSYRHVFAQGRTYEDASGTKRMMGSQSDLGELIQAEEQIREQAELLDHAQDAILAHDLEGRIHYWNKSAERVFGWSAAEVRGENVAALLYEKPDSYRSALEAVLSQGEWSGEAIQKTRSGCGVLMETRWSLLRGASGQPKAILSINTDITAKKQLETQFFRAQRMENMGTLAGGIAHDLNNVLAPIVMAIDLLKMRVSDSYSQELLELMDASAQRGVAMIKQVLYFARGVEGKRVPLSPNRLVQDLCKIVRDTFPKSIALETDTPEGLWNTIGDDTQLHQVLLNLCVNARDAMPEGGHLCIRVSNVYPGTPPEGTKSAAQVLFEVSDTGSGMPPELIEKIFEPFFTTKDIGKGTGLGLSTTLAIVTSHGGVLSLESEPGKGTTFRVSLPAAPGSETAGESTSSGELPHGEGQLILVIDDELPVRAVTTRTLEAFGYRVITASDGAEGIARYAPRHHQIAAVITDMMMPVMDGAATVRVLMRINPKVRIIATSGLSAMALEAEAAGQGIQHFLSKPYSAQTLLQTLHTVLAN